MVMRTAILHIGMHKTGSGSIQQSLAAQDWPQHHYVREGPPNHSVMLQTVLQGDLRKLKANQSGTQRKDLPTTQKRLRKNLEAELSRVTKPNIILSAEDLSGGNTVEKSIAEMLDLLQFLAMSRQMPGAGKEQRRRVRAKREAGK